MTFFFAFIIYVFEVNIHMIQYIYTYMHIQTYKGEGTNWNLHTWGLRGFQRPITPPIGFCWDFVQNYKLFNKYITFSLVHKEHPFLGVRNKEKKENGQLWQQPFIFNKYAILFFFLSKHVQLGFLSMHPFLHIDIFLKIIKGLNSRHSSAHLTKSHATYVYSSFWC